MTAALRFLTVLPLPAGRSGGGTGAAAFPVAGLAIGAATAAPLLLPLPDLARAALALSVAVALTGGLHEDAWADVCDAAFAPGDRARRLAVLGDSRVGAHGVTGVGLLLVLRLAALASVPPLSVVAAAVVGRWTMVAAAGLFPPARPGGLGAAFSGEARPGAATVSAGIALALVVALGGAGAASLALVVAAWAVGALAGAGAATFLTRRLGGLNGDGFGAVGVAAELGALWTGVVAAAGEGPWWS